MRLNHSYAILTVTMLPFLAGCISNPVNDYTRVQYYKAGMQAEASGDLETARRDYGRAQINAQMGNLGPVKEAYACYEWSRVTGYLGRFAEAEKGYADAMVLIDQSKGQADKLLAPLLCEYARMFRDSGQEQKAVPIYDRALTELDRIGAEGIDPLGLAEILDDYSQVLRSVGSKERADQIASRSVAIKDAHKGETAKTNNRQSYANAGRAAQRRNDWAAARMYWSRALLAAESAHLPPTHLVTYYYEYGRSLGAVAEFTGAETNLKTALQLDRDNNGNYFLDLSELARLNYDQHKFAEAAVFYGQDVAALESAKMDETAPAGFVELLFEYADCLRQIGQADAAGKIEARIAVIKAKHPILHSATDRTPYGKYPPKQG
jgi:tetratricopeptide (TPR) repeat protein